MRIALKPLAEQTIVITGASSGIGLGIAEAAVAAGARVMLSARNAAALAEIQQRLMGEGGDVGIFVVDIADKDAADRLAAATIDRFGGFDTWVNNAAVGAYGSVFDVSVADQRRMFDVGYWGVVAGSRAAAAHLGAKGGAIINIGSVLGDRTMILQGPYSAMKHAVQGFTDALRMELAQQRRPVSVTLIKPSAMHTPFPLHARNHMNKPAKLPPIIYDPRLVARAVLFAAHTPRRDLIVGGFGLGAVLGDFLAPRLLDKGMEVGGTAVQRTDRPPVPGTNDNLWQHRVDGSIESDQPQYVRRHSLFLEAQLRPGAAVLVGLALGGAALAVLRHNGVSKSPASRSAGPAAPAAGNRNKMHSSDPSPAVPTLAVG